MALTSSDTLSVFMAAKDLTQSIRESNYASLFQNASTKVETIGWSRHVVLHLQNGSPFGALNFRRDVAEKINTALGEILDRQDLQFEDNGNGVYKINTPVSRQDFEKIEALIEASVGIPKPAIRSAAPLIAR